MAGAPGCLAQLEMDGQNGLAGHGPALGGRGAEAREQDRLPGSFVHAETRALHDVHVENGPRFIQGEFQDHDPFFIQPSGFEGIPGLRHADNARTAWRTELYQAFSRPGTVLCVASSARSGRSGSFVAWCSGPVSHLLRTAPGSGLRSRRCGRFIADMAGIKACIVVASCKLGVYRQLLVLGFLGRAWRRGLGLPGLGL
jgi:hypothetical protein